MATCVFCRIIEETAAAHHVYADDAVVAFLDQRPVFKGHTLVVPRQHHGTLADLPAHALTDVMTVAQRLSIAIPAALGAQGTFVAMNNVVSQSVPHLHVHVIPRTKGDGLRGFFWPRVSYTDDAEAQDFADRIAAHL